MTDHPFWLVNYLTYNGTREIHGPQHNPVIMELIDWADGADDGKNLQGIRDDETPYCASALCGNFEECHIRSPRSAMARSFNNWGTKLAGPAVGAVVVFWRGSPRGSSGHVGLVVGRDKRGNLIVFGANQGDMFKHSPFDTARVLSYRWPANQPLPAPDKIGFQRLPIMASDGKISHNEA
jgi:uncharacterized protein (TIGR02594 family)